MGCNNLSMPASQLMLLGAECCPERDRLSREMYLDSNKQYTCITPWLFITLPCLLCVIGHISFSGMFVQGAKATRGIFIDKGQFCFHLSVLFRITESHSNMTAGLPIVTEFQYFVNTLRPRQNGCHFADDIFKCIFLNENVRISIKISLKFVPKDPINNIPALVQIMTWRRPGDKPLSEPTMASLLTHICVSQPQWVKDMRPWVRNFFWILAQNTEVFCYFSIIIAGKYWNFGKCYWKSWNYSQLLLK